MQSSKLVLVLVALALVCSLAWAQLEIEITKLGEPISGVDLGEGQRLCYFVKKSLLPPLTGDESVTFTVTPTSGDADLYIGVNGCPTDNCDPNTNCWKSDGPNGDIVSIPRSHTRWPAGDASFHMAIYGKTRTRVTLNVFTPLTHIAMKDGEPQSAKVVRRFDYTYFKFDLDNESNFTVVVTPVSGDPDIFAAVDHIYPNETHYDAPWKQREWGLDIVPIRKGDPKYKAPGTYYIGIHAFTITYFTLAITKDLNFTLLVEGVPLGHSVERNEYKYFKFQLVTITDKLIFNLNPLTTGGDPDIYIKFNNQAEKPSKTFYDVKNEAPGQDIVTWNNPTIGTYYIGVFGWNKCKFQISASTEFRTLLLNDGIPSKGYVEQGKWTFLKYHHGDSDSGLTVSFELNGGGSIDAYVSTKGTFTNPDKYELGRLYKYAGNPIFIREAPTPVGSYFFGVLGHVTTNFTVVAATNQSHTILRDGEVSFWNTVPKDYYRFFVFDITKPTEDVVITANAFRGEVNLYAAVNVEYPTRRNNTWRSEYWRQDTIVIPANDPKLQGKTRIFIGVGAELDSYFTVLAYHSDTTLEIRDGIQQKGVVSQDKYKYYKFFNQQQGQVTINLHPTGGGNPDLYASTVTEKPNDQHYEKKSTSFGDDVIIFPSVARGWVYIGVHGKSGSSTFTIVARVNFNFVDLNREAIQAFTAKGGQAEYLSYIWGCDNLVPALTLISGRTKMLVSSNSTAPLTWDNAHWKDSKWPGNVLLISKTDPHWKNSGNFKIAVQAVEDSDYFLSIACTTNDEYWWYAANLAHGIPRLGIAPPGQPVNYQFRVPYDSTGHPAFNYYIDIRVMKGNLGAYAHQDWNIIPSARNNTWNSTGMGSRTMNLRANTITSGRYIFVSFYGLDNKEAVYEVTISTANTPKFLMQDQQSTQVIGPLSYQAFRVLNARKAKDIYVHVEACGNTRPAPVIYGSFDYKYPNHTHHKYVSTKKTFFYQEMHAEFAPSEISDDPKVFYLGAENEERGGGLRFAVYASNKQDSRPKISTKTLVGGLRGDTLLIRFPQAKAPPGFKDSDLVYSIWFAHVPLKDNGEPEFYPNFYTACGVHSNGLALGQVTEIDAADNHYEFPIKNLDKSKIYRLNVIVSDGIGLEDAYEPVWYVDGRIYTEWPGAFRFQASAGFIIMLIGFLLFLAYFIVGVIIQSIRGRRGLQVIPNLSFWQDLPFLIKDGFVFVVTCCRKADSYSSFSDEPSVNTSGFEATPSASEPAPKEETRPTQSTGGYGSI